MGYARLQLVKLIFMPNHWITQLEEKFSLLASYEQKPGLWIASVTREQLVLSLEYLRNHLGFEHLVLLTAVDYIENGEFQLSYILNNPILKADLILRVNISRENSSMESAHHLWPTIATYQRELKEMFGIDFPGSPRVDEPFILEGWEGIPPYRRDFDTKAFSKEFYEHRPGRQTNDPASYMKEKLYPNE